MDCCQCQAIEEQFDRKKAAKKRHPYQQDGLKRESQMLVDALLTFSLDSCSNYNDYSCRFISGF